MDLALSVSTTARYWYFHLHSDSNIVIATCAIFMVMHLSRRPHQLSLRIWLKHTHIVFYLTVPILQSCYGISALSRCCLWIHAMPCWCPAILRWGLIEKKCLLLRIACKQGKVFTIHLRRSQCNYSSNKCPSKRPQISLSQPLRCLICMWKNSPVGKISLFHSSLPSV